MLIKDLGRMARAVYEPSGSDKVDGVGPIARHSAAGTLWDAFQAASYAKGGQTAIVFRGTNDTGDLVTDAALGLGMNSGYYAQAETFVNQHGSANVILCGHSLGGAIAQVVGNRMGLPIVTFNAPGVAVIASRNMGSASVAATTVRVAGMLASAVVRPGQAIQDMRAAFNVVRGINIALSGDVVSLIGVHYGRVERIRGLSSNPKTEHKMDTMNTVLSTHELGNRQAMF
jgi:pimeloyl-ACP methyl ester carboxylesterase